MCQSKAEGGRRCRAHNCAAEHRRAKRDATKARKKYDELGNKYAEKLTAGDVTDDDRAEIAAAQADLETKRLIAAFSDPKAAQWYKAAILPLLPEEYRNAAAGIADGVIAHQQQAARLAGQARTEKMFDRTDTAEQFEAEADEERSKAARLADALRGAFYDTKSIAGEAISDALAGSDDDNPTTEPGVFRSFLIELLEAADDVVTETAESLAAGVGVTAPDPTTPDKIENIHPAVPTTNDPTDEVTNDAPLAGDDPITDEPSTPTAGTALSKEKKKHVSNGGDGSVGDHVSTTPVGKVKTGSQPSSPIPTAASPSTPSPTKNGGSAGDRGGSSPTKPATMKDSPTGTATGNKHDSGTDSVPGDNKNTNGTAAPARSGSGVADDHRSPLAWLSDKITGALSHEEAAQPADLSTLTDDELLTLIARLQGHRR